jgi:CheY-like chemotaxis protein
MVERLLGQAGYRAEVQGSGTEALQRLRGEPGAFDIVITDYNMPGLSGLDVARELADLCPGTPVYISSGYITEELLSKAQAAGVRGVLQKQNTLEDLLPMLQGRAETLSPARP